MPEATCFFLCLRIFFSKEIHNPPIHPSTGNLTKKTLSDATMGYSFNCPCVSFFVISCLLLRVCEKVTHTKHGPQNQNAAPTIQTGITSKCNVFCIVFNSSFQVSSFSLSFASLQTSPLMNAKAGVRDQKGTLSFSAPPLISLALLFFGSTLYKNRHKRERNTERRLLQRERVSMVLIKNIWGWHIGIPFSLTRETGFFLVCVCCVFI
jgi:hypothetical protein